MTTLELALPYVPRWYQQEFEDAMFSGKRRAYLLYHRRAGKDIACFNFMVNCAIGEGPKVYYYVFPTYSQGKKAIWDGIDQDGRPIIDYIPPQLIESKNGTEMKIRLINGAIIQIVGSEKPDSLRGPNVYGAVFSEYAAQNPRAWSEVISPMVDANGGWVVFNTTPLGKNHAYDLWVTAGEISHRWYRKCLTIEETKNIITQETVENKRKEGISEEIIQQEYYCSFERGVEGSYYGRIMAMARINGHIGRIHYDPCTVVNTYWDIGYGDSTAIVFSQDVAGEHRIIDYYEASGEGIAHYVKMLQNKTYVYGKHYLPHDAGAGSVQTGISLQRTAAELGLQSIVLPRYDFEVGIEAARSMLQTAFIDEAKCKHLIKCLENYHKKHNDTLNCYSNTPVHDWSSHACFTGDTKVLTRNGTYQIMDLPKNGEVMTQWGWKKYLEPQITKRNARLVEVKFVDGTTVRCTPDHMFLTAKGWRYAKDLMSYSEIQSYWMNSRNISMEAFIGYGRTKGITPVEERKSKELYGKARLGKFLKAATFIIEMVTKPITDWIIWNVSMPLNILNWNGRFTEREGLVLAMQLARRPLNGTDLTQEDFGISVMQNDLSHGRFGNGKKNFVYSVKNHIWRLFVKMGILRNSVETIVKPLTIVSVCEIAETEDVWCFGVPEVGHFALSNGAIVHNCDAIRYCALARLAYGKGAGTGLTPDKIKEMRQRNLGY